MLQSRLLESTDGYVGNDSRFYWSQDMVDRGADNDRATTKTRVPARTFVSLRDICSAPDSRLISVGRTVAERGSILRFATYWRQHRVRGSFLASSWLKG